MSAESPRHVRSGGPLTVPSQPPSDRSIIDAVSGFINDVTLSSSSAVDPKDVIQWARFETADINEPTPEGDSDNDISPLLLILGYGTGVQVWLIPPSGEAQEVLSWRQGTVRVLRILPTPQHGDCFASKRPLIALCDSASPGPTFCSLSFISIRGGEQVKSIKFKNPILDVLANKRSVVVSFSERFAVFDAATLEDRMTVTTCYPCPCPLGGSAPINPLALGDRWLAYADKKLNQSKRSSGGCEGEGVTSYTATVLHAAKSLSKGLRGLGESVAHSLAGGRSTSQSPSPPNADMQQPGVVTVLDIESNEEDDGQDIEEPYDPIVAHFIAHSEAIIALKFDASGMLLVTADRRGHDFHVFRINPHPCGPSLASVHHLYILHRGDTTAKVQDIAISWDARWAAVSTLRGTTHVFALSPYGGAAGVRTHTQPRLVNRLSRFHRSAGLPIHAATSRAGKRASPANAASTSPVTVGAQGSWFPNPRLPPYPLPTWAAPLAQLRPTNLPTHTITRTSSGRQRLSSLSEDSNSAPLLARARFGMCISGSGSVSGSGRAPAPVAALYLMAANGALLHLLLHPRPASSIPKEKICDDSPIELEVEPVAQWPLQRPPAAADLLAPLPPSNPLLQPNTCRRCADMCMSEEERWLSQVEIVTHAGPHRRLWMGPQFVFKTYSCTGSNSSLSEAETVEVETSAASVARSNPVNMPGVRPVVPVLVDSGSASSLEQSPLEGARRKSLAAEARGAAAGGAAAGAAGGGGVCDVQLREDLAEAMKEDHVITGSGRYEAEPEELSSSSFSSASRASLDPPSSPTPSCSGDNLLHFPGDSSSSV
ncbi:breast carcinoma-amplified sequence 3 homolog isoform 2-T2 [Aphomia sociella]